MFLPGVPILCPNCLEDLGALGALEPPLVTVLVGRQPLLGAELLPAGGAGELLSVDLGVLLEVALMVGLEVTVVTFELGGLGAGFSVQGKVLCTDINATGFTFSDTVGIEVVREFFLAVKSLMTDITLRLYFFLSSPVYLCVVLLDLGDCRKLLLPESHLSLLLCFLFCSLGGVPGLSVSWR